MRVKLKDNDIMLDPCKMGTGSLPVVFLPQNGRAARSPLSCCFGGQPPCDKTVTSAGVRRVCGGG